jgi:GT2 family glycosyltransferase
MEDLGTWRHHEERTVDLLVGACLLVRAVAFAEVDGFDEAFWLYFEEVDLQRRLSLRGWRVVFTPTARVTHVGSASSRSSTSKLSDFYDGQRRFFRKHGTSVSWPTARVALLVGSLLRGRWGSARVVFARRPGPR